MGCLLLGTDWLARVWYLTPHLASLKRADVPDLHHPEASLAEVSHKGDDLRSIKGQAEQAPRAPSRTTLAPRVPRPLPFTTGRKASLNRPLPFLASPAQVAFISHLAMRMQAYAYVREERVPLGLLHILRKVRQTRTLPLPP